MAITETKITLCGHGSGTPSTKNMKTYLTQRYNTKASNGVRKGIVAVMRLKKLTTDAKRKSFHDTYKKILGRNTYSQTKRQYVYTKASNGKYYSDCSSSIMATLQQIGFNVTLLNTAGIYQSSLFEQVPVKIVNGHILNPELLKVGDCLLFAGDDASRPLQIGHIEAVYEINGKTTSTVPKVPTCIPLKIGSGKKHPTAVKRLKRCLNYLGYTSDNGKRLTVNSTFNKKCKQALNAFKKDYGLPTGGTYGAKAKKKMLELVK